ncbi:MAG: Gfo/Idh/MocA family protein [Acidimicrobiales bacterium]
MRSALRAVVAGTSFGARIHVPALRAAGMEVVALVGNDRERTARRAGRLGIPGACGSLDEALDLGPDVVSLATPPATHAPLARAAVAAGCHVLCEKPFTLEVAEAADLVAAAAEAGVVGVVGHEFRFSHAQALVWWALRRGVVGEPRLALDLAFLPMLRQFAMPDWWFDPAAGGGWLGAAGSHRIDRLRQWFGEIEAVSATAPSLADPPFGTDDGFHLRCRLRGGVEAVLLQSAAAAGPAWSASRVLGTAGTLWQDGHAVLVAGQDDPAGTPLPVPDELALPEVEPADGPLAAMTRTELPPYVALADAMRRAIEGSPAGDGPAPATFADGLACMEVLAAARRSAGDGGRWIELGGPGRGRSGS